MYEMKPYLDRIEQIIQEGPFTDTWESLSAYRVPEWYQKLKFGIFIHWGVFSVPAFANEWYPRNMYIQGTPEYEHHTAVYGPHRSFGYKDLVPLFKAEKFVPEQWADLFVQSGAQYVVPVAEHHDGFQMYDSALSHWNAREKGPKRDVLGELEEAFSARQMVCGASTHRIEHWFFQGHGREFDSDVREPMERGDLYWPARILNGSDGRSHLMNADLSDGGVSNAGVQDGGVPNAVLPDAGMSNAALSDGGVPNAALSDAGVSDADDSDTVLSDSGFPDEYQKEHQKEHQKEPQQEDTFDIYSRPAPTEEFLQDWMIRTCELIDRYHPRILYFDWWIQHESAKPYLKKIAAYYYNQALSRGEDLPVINYKYDAFVFGTAVPDVERGQFADIKPYLWQTDTAIALNSWCYTEGNIYRSADELVRDFVDIVSKNGRLLLNVGPKADGTISDQETNILQKIGRWLKINGEAIYDTSVWKIYGEGPTQILDGSFSDSVKKDFTCEDFRFTMGRGNLYAIALKGSESGDYCIHSLAQEASANSRFNGIIQDVMVLTEYGSAGTVWEMTGDGLKIHTDFQSEMPVAFRVVFR